MGWKELRIRLHPRGKDVFSRLRGNTRFPIPCNGDRIFERMQYPSLQMLNSQQKSGSRRSRPNIILRHWKVHKEQSRYPRRRSHPASSSSPNSRDRPVGKERHKVHERGQSDLGRRRVEGIRVRKPGSVPKNRIEGVFYVMRLSRRTFRTGLHLRCVGMQEGRGTVGRGR